jgi:hypothetical protein
MDRERLRLRARAGLEIKPHPDFTLGVRARSGPKDSQQSPHVTLVDFDNNPVGDQDAAFDKWFMQYDKDLFKIWAGRNSFPFWEQNELFWDDDATSAGIAASYNFPVEPGKLSFNVGFFTLPDGGYDFHGQLAAGQIVYSRMINDINLTLGGGIFKFNGKAGADNLRNGNGNGNRDYIVWVGNAQMKYNWLSVPITLGVDVLHNSEDIQALIPILLLLLIMTRQMDMYFH